MAKKQRESKEFKRVRNALYDTYVDLENLEAALDDFDDRFGGAQYTTGTIEKEKKNG